MQDQRAIQNEPTEAQPGAIVQTQPARSFGRYGSNRIILAALVGLGLLAAGIFGIQTLSSGQSSSATRALSPVNALQEDPPLPAGWVDSYFDRLPAIPVETDPPLPDGWVDPYFSRPAALPDQEDPPLPAGWSDPYFQQTD